MTSPNYKNAIWIFGDQHRAQALSCNGDPNVNTPHLDRLSTEGLNYERAVAGMPLCCPFRGSLLTSRYPHECVPGHEHQLPPEMPTIAHAFKEHGFETAYFGKWHLDGFHEREGRAAMHIIPPEHRGGFDIWTGYENNNSQWDCWVHGGAGSEAFHRQLPGYETDCLTDMLIEYIGKQGKRKRPERNNRFLRCCRCSRRMIPIWLRPNTWPAIRRDSCSFGPMYRMWIGWSGKPAAI